MNLEKSEIRIILSEIYREACLLEKCDMRVLAVALEDIAAVLYEFPATSAWQKIKLDKQRFDKSPYVQQIVKFREKVMRALRDKIIASIHQHFKKDKKQAFDLWFHEYVEALVNWQGEIFGALCDTAFDFDADERRRVAHYAVLNELILDNKWPETYDYFLEFSENSKLTPLQQSSFMVYAGQVMMYHLNYPDRAKALFDQAHSIDQSNGKVERVFGEYALFVKNLEKARSKLLNAISIDAHDIENYTYMGDTYLEEKKLNAAEQWYNDALNINFLDTLPLSKLIILSAEDELIDSRKEFIDEQLDKALILEKNGKYENSLYNLYRDAGYAYSKTGKYDQSKKYYEKAIALKPDFSAAMIDLAYILAYDKKYEDAKEWFVKSIEAGVEGNNFASYWGLGWLCEQLGEVDEAMEAYKKCEDQRRFGNDRVYNILGILNYNKKSYDEAAIYYRKAIAENASESVYYDNLKNALEKKGDQEALKAFYEDLAGAFPDRHDYLNQIGVYYHNQGDYQKAITFYSRAIAIEPKKPVYWENRALAKELLRLYVDAEEDYLKALELGENDNLLNSLGVVKFRQQNYQGALDYFGRAIKLEKANPLYYENIGLAYENLGKLKDAEASYKTAIEISKEDARYLNRLGLYYHNRQQYDEAAEWYERAAEKDKANILYQENVAIAYENLKKYEEAEAIYRQLLVDHSDDLFINARLVSVLLFQKKYGEVEELADVLLQKHPKELELYQIKGTAYEEQYLYKQALDTYKKALGVDPGNEYFNNRMGIMHYYLGTPSDLNAALEYYQKAINANPKMGIYYKNLELVYRALGNEQAAEEALQKANAVEN